MSAKAFLITGVSIVQIKENILLVFVRETHRSPVDSTHKGSVMRKMIPFDDVIIDVFSNLWLT